MEAQKPILALEILDSELGPGSDSGEEYVDLAFGL